MQKNIGKTYVEVRDRKNHANKYNKIHNFRDKIVINVEQV